MKHAQRIRKILLVAWILIGAALIIGIISLNLPLDGRLAVTAVPGEPSAFFGGFRPDQRVSVIPGSYAILEDEPIYFAMAVPPFFRRAIVRLEYLNEGQPKMELGGRTSLEAWQFDLKPLVTVATDGEWHTGEAVFDLGSLSAGSRMEVQMVVSMPAMQNGNASVVKVRKIDILYEREPLTFTSVLSALKRRLSPRPKD